MNLWLVFANSLEQIEPSADFRARLVRIAELSNRVLTIPKRHKRVREPAILISSLVMMSLVLITLLIFTWIAGRQSARLDEQRGNAELQRLTQELAQKQVDEQQQKDHIRALEEKQTSTGPFEVAQQKKLENSLSTALASVEQLKAIINRDGQKTEVNTVLVSALSAPGAKLLTFKNAEGLSSTAYAFIVENSKVIFVASNLAPPADQHQYQLWLVRKDEPRFVSAGLFATLDDKPVVVTYSEDKEAITNLAGLSVTEEPLDGSKEPTGKRVMETSGAAAITALAPSAPEID